MDATGVGYMGAGILYAIYHGVLLLMCGHHALETDGISFLLSIMPETEL